MHTKKFSILLVLLSLIINSSVTHARSFSDVPENYLYFKSINQLTNQGCINGYSDGTFKPDNDINRAETLKVLLTCLDLPNIYTEQKISAPTGTKVTIDGIETVLDKSTEISLKIPFNPEMYDDLNFKDINNTEWFIPTLKESIVRKIITGYNDNTIRPNQAVSKAELYTILYRLTPKELQEIQTESPLANDIASGFWFYTPLQFALENKLLTTDSNNLISPHKSLTRGQVAHFVYEYKTWLQDFIAPETTDNQSSKVDQKDTNQENEKIEETPTQEKQNTTNDELTQETEDPSSQKPSNTTNNIEVGFTESGIASYYGYSFDGRRTASGELLDTATFMAAHKTLPFGTIIRVTNEEGYYVDCRVVDRGPYPEGRIVDLTPAAFEVLAPLSKGLTKVTIEVISLPKS